MLAYQPAPVTDAACWPSSICSLGDHSDPVDCRTPSAVRELCISAVVSGQLASGQMAPSASWWASHRSDEGCCGLWLGANCWEERPLTRRPPSLWFLVFHSDDAAPALAGHLSGGVAVAIVQALAPSWTAWRKCRLVITWGHAGSRRVGSLGRSSGHSKHLAPEPIGLAGVLSHSLILRDWKTRGFRCCSFRLWRHSLTTDRGRGVLPDRAVFWHRSSCTKQARSLWSWRVARLCTEGRTLSRRRISGQILISTLCTLLSGPSSIIEAILLLNVMTHSTSTSDRSRKAHDPPGVHPSPIET